MPSQTSMPRAISVHPTINVSWQLRTNSGAILLIFQPRTLRTHNVTTKTL